jgi:hypothetical protein
MSINTNPPGQRTMVQFPADPLASMQISTDIPVSVRVMAECRVTAKRLQWKRPEPIQTGRVTVSA